ncbi:hypothetical protein PITC_095050 [Penicillium italicum]|uniref:Uncharacterized protein n=1 Tax=Penicillium italicum TaxID=40296 RepID=A0A0A2KQX3_PENIT|nr:hypothetical protein PITC_095050 [Penicillium italicum]
MNRVLLLAIGLFQAGICLLALTDVVEQNRYNSAP